VLNVAVCLLPVRGDPMFATELAVADGDLGDESSSRLKVRALNGCTWQHWCSPMHLH
jgi:hypothetical protein